MEKRSQSSSRLQTPITFAYLDALAERGSVVGLSSVTGHDMETGDDNVVQY